uniref:Uncharacterized protein n=1 Tax=Oryza glumipatula TaxID=40148 RepID=A0A0E0BJP8_9ORYZ
MAGAAVVPRAEAGGGGTSMVRVAVVPRRDLVPHLDSAVLALPHLAPCRSGGGSRRRRGAMAVVAGLSSARIWWQRRPSRAWPRAHNGEGGRRSPREEGRGRAFSSQGQSRPIVLKQYEAQA